MNNLFDELSIKSDYYREQLQAGFRKTAGYNELEMDEPAGFAYASSFVFGDAPPKGKTTDYLSAAVGWVYACVSAISDAVAGTEFELYKINDKNEIEFVPDHPALDLLFRVNKYTTAFDHFWLTQQYLELAGEAPWLIDRGEGGKGEPQNILLLRPDRLDIKKSDDPEAENPIAKYLYKSSVSKVTEIEPTELIFLKYPDPVNTFRGKGTLQAAANTVDVDQFSEDFNRRFFYNSARPDSVLSTDQKLTPRQRDSLRADVKRIYQGKENAHKTAILESGLKWEPMQLSQKDMDFLQQQRFTMMKILSIFRTPKPIVAISDDVNLANAQVAEYVFAKWTIAPKISRIVAQLNEFYLPMFAGTENMFLDYIDPVPTNIEMNLKRYDSGLGKGYMTINEIREELNLEDIGEAGDKVYLPAGMTPIELAGVSSTPYSLTEEGLKARRFKKKGLNKIDVVRRSAGGYGLAVRRLGIKKRKAKEVEAKIARIDSAINQVVKGMIEKIVVAKTKNVKSQNKINQMSRDEKTFKHVESYLKAADRLEGKFKGVLNEQFERQKNQIVGRFSEKALNVDDYLLDEKDETQILVEVSKPLLKEIVVDQGELAAELIGSDSFDEMTKRVQNYLKKRALKFSFEMTEETNNLLKVTLAEGVKLGESIPQIRKRVEELFEGMEKYRSERIARSEVIRASNFGAKEAYRQSGVVEELEWLTTDDENTCEFCAPLNGEVIKINENFFDRGDKYRGSDGGVLDLDYESVQHPPLHPNCRCTIIPVVK